MKKLKINNSMKKARYEFISCSCNKGIVLEEYPLIDCLHCKFKERYDSIPINEFEVNEPVIKDKKIVSYTKRMIKEITIVRGLKYQEVMGWKW